MERKFVRSFFAIPISPECKQKIYSIQQILKNELSSGIRWVNSDNLHITFKFLGEFNSKHTPNIFELLKEGLSATGQFDLIFQDLGVFPNNQKPKVVWVGLSNSIELPIIFQEIENAAAKLGYPEEERGFSPHVTIGRVKNEVTDPKTIGAVINDFKIGEICLTRVDRVVFYQSALTPAGPLYSELFQLPLNR